MLKDGTEGIFVQRDVHESWWGAGVEFYGLDMKCPSKVSYVWIITTLWKCIRHILNVL